MSVSVTTKIIIVIMMLMMWLRLLLTIMYSPLMIFYHLNFILRLLINVHAKVIQWIFAWLLVLLYLHPVFNVFYISMQSALSWVVCFYCVFKVKAMMKYRSINIARVIQFIPCIIHTVSFVLPSCGDKSVPGNLMWPVYAYPIGFCHFRRLQKCMWA